MSSFQAQEILQRLRKGTSPQSENVSLLNISNETGASSPFRHKVESILNLLIDEKNEDENILSSEKSESMLKAKLSRSFNVINNNQCLNDSSIDIVKELHSQLKLCKDQLKSTSYEFSLLESENINLRQQIISQRTKYERVIVNLRNQLAIGDHKNQSKPRNGAITNGPKFAKALRNNIPNVHTLAQKYVSSITADNADIKTDHKVQDIVTSTNTVRDDDLSLVSKLNQSDGNQETFTNILIDAITGNCNKISVNEGMTNKFIYIPTTSQVPLSELLENKSTLMNRQSSMIESETLAVSASHNHISQFGVIDSNQYCTHNNQQIANLEYMNNLYRHHLQQISLRTNQAQKLNTHQQFGNRNVSNRFMNNLVEVFSNSQSSQGFQINDAYSNSAHQNEQEQHDDADPRYLNPVWNNELKSLSASPLNHKMNKKMSSSTILPRVPSCDDNDSTDDDSDFMFNLENYI